jgi:hypothetical protein
MVSWFYFFWACSEASPHERGHIAEKAAHLRWLGSKEQEEDISFLKSALSSPPNDLKSPTRLCLLRFHHPSLNSAMDEGLRFYQIGLWRPLSRPQQRGRP